MKPGPELDALIAEHVMEVGAFSECMQQDPYLCYSTNITAAWEVVKKVKESLGDFARFVKCILEVTEGEVDDPYQCFFNFFGFENAPHAICLAALKAKGIKIEN